MPCGRYASLMGEERGVLEGFLSRITLRLEPLPGRKLNHNKEKGGEKRSSQLICVHIDLKY